MGCWEVASTGPPRRRVSLGPRIVRGAARGTKFDDIGLLLGAENDLRGYRPAFQINIARAGASAGAVASLDHEVFVGRLLGVGSVRIDLAVDFGRRGLPGGVNIDVLKK
tara:strand:+ start:20621 stop:20947 length:327 start_codon:yes stop_codon:yes gene_type:complete